jgi:2-polyprenyl-6-methoxyphenol hydroxylase-like FAD-dependent oxidoreductase
MKVAVVGASLGGLSAANVLSRLGCEVTVFELFRGGFDDRGGALGAVDTQLVGDILGGSGKKATNIKGHGHFYGSLWRAFYDGLPENTVQFGSHVEALTNQDTQPLLSINGTQHGPYDFVVGADGGASAIRKYVTDEVPKYAGYTVWRGLCPTDGVPGPPSGSAQLNGARFETLGFPMTKPDGSKHWNCGIYMPTAPSDIPLPPSKNRQIAENELVVPEWFLPFVKKTFGDYNHACWSGCIAKGKVAAHPVWEFAPRAARKGRVILLGDALHMSSPRTGAGAYTAMIDAKDLGLILSNSDSVDAALNAYNTSAVKRSDDLHRRSRQAGSYFSPRPEQNVSPASMLTKEEL